MDALHQELALNANQATQEKIVKLFNAYRIVENALSHLHAMNVTKDISYLTVNLPDNNKQINLV